jgi:hypothetical protein
MKPNLRVNPVKKTGPKLHGLTWIIPEKLSLKDYFKRFSFHIKKILFYSSKLKYLNQKGFLSHIENI